MTANVFDRGYLTCIKCSDGKRSPAASLCFYTVPYYTSAAPEYILAQEMQQITTFEKKPRQRERKIIYKA